MERWRYGRYLTLSIICKSVLNYDVESETEEVDRALTISRNYSKRLQTPLGQVLNKIPVLPNVSQTSKGKVRQTCILVD